MKRVIRGGGKEMFTAVSGRYDLLNRFLSFGRDRAWRRRACMAMRFSPGGRLLDVASGTGDLAMAAACHHRDIRVTGLDVTGAMLRAAAGKIASGGLGGRIGLVEGDALALPFADGSFDAAAVAFGIRNMPDRPAVLREMVRAVVLGGQVLVLEFAPPSKGLFGRLYLSYLDAVLPRLAGLLSPYPPAYLHLAESIKSFPAPSEFARLMGEAGLEGVTWKRLTGGVTCLYTGFKPGTG